MFFACGACHILAYAFVDRYPSSGFKPIWVKPIAGYTGNHIAVVRNNQAFDYHGYSNWHALRSHEITKANRWWPGWQAKIIELPMEVLISEKQSRQIEGLWLREPKQFLHDAMPRAQRFLD